MALIALDRSGPRNVRGRIHHHSTARSSVTFEAVVDRRAVVSKDGGGPRPAR